MGVAPLTSPPANAYPAILVGRHSAVNENKPKIPPPVPPRGTPKAKKTGVVNGGKGAMLMHEKVEKEHGFVSNIQFFDSLTTTGKALLHAPTLNSMSCDVDIEKNSNTFLPEDCNVDSENYVSFEKKFCSLISRENSESYSKSARVKRKAPPIPCEFKNLINIHSVDNLEGDLV